MKTNFLRTASGMLLAVSLLGLGQVRAQQVLTLEQCIEFAILNSPNIQKAQIDAQSAGFRVKELLADGYPQVNGSFEFSDNPQIATAFLPAVFFAEDAINNPPPVDAPAIPVRFGVRFSGQAAASLNQLIFDGTFFLGVKAANVYKELSEKAVVQSKTDVAANVAKAYYGVLVNRSGLEMLEENYRRIDTLLAQTRAMYVNGFAEKIDVDRIEVSFNNTKTDLQKTKRLIDYSLAVLKFQMGMDPQENINVAGELDEADLRKTQLAGSDFDFRDRIEYSILETQVQLDEMNVKRFRAGYYPTVYGFASYGANAGAMQFRDMDKWFALSNYGLRISLPIFDGLRKSHQIQQAKLTQEKTRIDQLTLKRSITLEEQQFSTELRNGLEELDNQERNMRLAEEIFRVTKIKYQEGVGSALEVIDAESSYKQAYFNYYSALYNAFTAKVDYERATGSLPVR